LLWFLQFYLVTMYMCFQEQWELNCASLQMLHLCYFFIAFIYLCSSFSDNLILIPSNIKRVENWQRTRHWQWFPSRTRGFGYASPAPSSFLPSVFLRNRFLHPSSLPGQVSFIRTISCLEGKGAQFGEGLQGLIALNRSGEGCSYVHNWVVTSTRTFVQHFKDSIRSILPELIGINSLLEQIT